MINEPRSLGRAVSGNQLLTHYRGNVVPYADLTEPYMKSITQWLGMENGLDDYANDEYGVVTIPMMDAMMIIYNQIGGDKSFDEFWAPVENHGFEEEWPIVWTIDGITDGVKRFTAYRDRGLMRIPVVVPNPYDARPVE